MPKIKSTQPPKQSTDELFQEHQPRSIHTINLQPDPPELPTPKSEADKSSLLTSLDPILDLLDAKLHSINYLHSLSNSAISISILASTHSANFVKSLLHHHPNQHQPKPEPQDVPF